MDEKKPRQFKGSADAARAAAKADSQSTFGRQHGRAWNYDKHHTYDTYVPECGACQTDVLKGIHPNAPTEEK
jgi:hypothetical protein